ncbi:MAG: type II secretion system F family protein [Planctomycetaceae bacterium]
MFTAFLILIWLALLAGLFIWWRSIRQREAALERFSAAFESRDATEVQYPGRRLRRRWMWVPWVLGLVVALVIALIFRLAPPYVLAIALMTSLLSSQVEVFLAGQMAARLENQLADAIDIMIGAVGAGASVGTAIESAVTESRLPLRPYLEEISGRIRLGDEPSEVFRSLAQRVPLETFLLFTSALSVHWEVGGRLTSTLTTVGRTIRDRTEISRRIRSNTAQSQFSTIALLGLTYFIALIVWNNGRDQMEEFVRSSIGSWFVAGSVILQSVGIVWMNVISKARF